MPRSDPYETAIMAQCRRGDPLPHGGSTGAVCRKPHLCRDEGRCYFVARMERYLELHNGQMPTSPVLVRIEWHPGYDGFRWAL